MIDFIPIKIYYDIYIYFCYFLVLANLLHAYTVPLNDPKNLKFLRTSGLFLLVLVTFYLGLRPLSSSAFGDMVHYSRYFNKYAQGFSINTEKGFLFHYYMKTLSYGVSLHSFFLIPQIYRRLLLFLRAKTYCNSSL